MVGIRGGVQYLRVDVHEARNLAVGDAEGTSDPPVQPQTRVPLCGARTLNATGQLRVILSLQ